LVCYSASLLPLPEMDTRLDRFGGANGNGVSGGELSLTRLPEFVGIFRGRAERMRW
jgi:hypothetical protein